VKRVVEVAGECELRVVHLVAHPGFMFGLEAERSGPIRYGVEAMNAVYKASVPWASVIVAPRLWHCRQCDVERRTVPISVCLAERRLGIAPHRRWAGGSI